MFMALDLLSIIRLLVEHVRMIRKDRLSALIAVYIQSHSLCSTVSSNTFQKSMQKEPH